MRQPLAHHIQVAFHFAENRIELEIADTHATFEILSEIKTGRKRAPCPSRSSTLTKLVLLRRLLQVHQCFLGMFCAAGSISLFARRHRALEVLDSLLGMRTGLFLLGRLRML